MQREQRQCLDEFDREIAIARRVDAVRCRSIEAKFVGHQSTIERESRSRHSTRSQRTEIQPLADVGQPVRVTQKHFNVSEQPVANQHRFCPLQVRVGRNSSITSMFCSIHDCATQFGQFFPQLINRSPDEQPQISRNLFIPAAPAMQLVANLADQCDQLLLDKVVDVFRLIVLEESQGSRRLLANLLQPLQNADQFIRRQYPGILQRSRMRGARRKLVLQQTSVKTERPLPALEFRIQRLPEPSRPHLHCATSTRDRARDRDGSPRMRMNPSASFWSYSVPIVNDDRSVRYSECSDCRLAMETFPLYNDKVTDPVM